MVDVIDSGAVKPANSGPLPVCLLVEDEAFLATRLEIEFSEAGFEIAGPFKRVENALAWLEHGRPHIAVIDTQLEDGSSAPLARALEAKGIPFIVHSGSDPDSRGEDPTLFGTTWLTKPVLPSVVVQEAQRIIAARSFAGDAAT